MKLLATQQHFARMVGELIREVHLLGYNCTLGDAYRDPRVTYGHPKSLHRSRLAIDLNLFRGDEYLSDVQAEQAHGMLHDWWDKQGGAERIAGDLNHYSWPWGNMR